MSLTPGKQLRELEGFLGKYGISIVDSAPGRTHRKVWITDGVKTVFIVVAVSPSDHRAVHNIAKSARKTLREAHEGKMRGRTA
jgi:hypothetical protein